MLIFSGLQNSPVVVFGLPIKAEADLRKSKFLYSGFSKYVPISGPFYLAILTLTLFVLLIVKAG